MKAREIPEEVAVDPGVDRPYGSTSGAMDRIDVARTFLRLLYMAATEIDSEGAPADELGRAAFLALRDTSPFIVEALNEAWRLLEDGHLYKDLEKGNGRAEGSTDNGGE